jgi:hypothetical protein
MRDWAPAIVDSIDLLFELTVEVFNVVGVDTDLILEVDLILVAADPGEL